MRVVRIKNNIDSEKLWIKSFAANEEFEIPGDNSQLIETYANCDALLTSIANNEASIGNGIEYFSAVHAQINWLKGIYSLEVTTQQEKNDRDKKIAKCKTTIDANSTGYLFIKIPGTININQETGEPVPNIETDRLINGGEVFFTGAEYGDYLELIVTANNDPQNLVIAKSFTEEAENGDEKNGWYVNPAKGWVALTVASAAYGYSGFYLCIVWHAINAGSQRKLYANIDWDLRTP
jgi:hypothetical protein